MCIEDIEGKLSKKKYSKTEEVIADFELMFDNCRVYNGPECGKAFDNIVISVVY